MRGKSCSMDGIPDFSERSTFYVPGERHENLPAGGFAGSDDYPSYATMGTPVQTLIPDTREPEYATGGSGMFQGADFGHGKLIALHGPRRRSLGQDDSSPSFMDMLSQGLSTVSDVAQAIGPAQAQAAAPAASPSAAPSAVARAFSPSKGGIMSKKIAGLPAVAVIAIAMVGGYFVYKKVSKKR